MQKVFTKNHKIVLAFKIWQKKFTKFWIFLEIAVIFFNLQKFYINEIIKKIQNKYNPVLFSRERANNMYTASVITEKQLIKKALSACRNRQLRISKRLKTSFSNWFSSAKNS